MRQVVAAGAGVPTMHLGMTERLRCLCSLAHQLMRIHHTEEHRSRIPRSQPFRRAYAPLRGDWLRQSGADVRIWQRCRIQQARLRSAGPGRCASDGYEPQGYLHKWAVNDKARRCGGQSHVPCRRAPALLRAGHSTASGDVGAVARITWCRGNYMKQEFTPVFFLAQQRSQQLRA